MTTGTKDEKLEKMRDPELRQALVAEADEADRRLQVIQAGVGGDPARLVVQGVNRQQDLQQYVGRSIGEIAEAEGKHPIEVMLDLSLAGDLNVEFLGPDRGSNAEFMAEMIELAVRHPRRVRRRRPHEVLHRRCLHHRLPDLARARRGRRSRWRTPTSGCRTSPPRPPGSTTAARCARAPPPTCSSTTSTSWPSTRRGSATSTDDLPGGEWRRVQRAIGYQQIIVNGEVTFEAGECTGATPGQLLRGGRG